MKASQKGANIIKRTLLLYIPLPLRILLSRTALPLISRCHILLLHLRGTRLEFLSMDQPGRGGDDQTSLSDIQPRCFHNPPLLASSLLSLRRPCFSFGGPLILRLSQPTFFASSSSSFRSWQEISIYAAHRRKRPFLSLTDGASFTPPSVLTLCRSLPFFFFFRPRFFRLSVFFLSARFLLSSPVTLGSISKLSLPDSSPFLLRYDKETPRKAGRN